MTPPPEISESPNFSAESSEAWMAAGRWPRDRCDRWFRRSLAGLTIVHLFILLTSPLGLVSDEALYWEYSKHPDWSYYAKGPAIGWAIRLSTLIFGDTVFGVRFTALACFTLFSAMMYLFVRKLFSPRTALFAFLLVRLTTMFGVNGFIITTDPLILPLWLGSLIYAHRALTEDRPSRWIPAFFLAGIGVLAKFTEVLLLPAYGAAVLFSKKRRKQLLHPASFLAVIAFFVAVAPLIIWNMQHDWVNLGHNVGHTVSAGKSSGIPFRRFPELLLSQLGLVGPIALPLMLVALARGIRRWLKQADEQAGLFVLATAPLLAVCIVVTATRACYANWPLPAYVGGVLLLAREFESAGDRRWYRRALYLNAGIFLILQLSWYSTLFLPDRVPLPVPIRRMVGWDTLTKQVERAVAERTPPEAPEKRPFILALDYMTESSLRFSGSPAIELQLGSFTGRRLTEQDYWQNWDGFQGRDAIVLSTKEALIEEGAYRGWFSSCERIAVPGLPPETRLAKPFVFHLCKNFNGKPPAIDRPW